LHILSVRSQIDYLLNHPKVTLFPPNKLVVDVVVEQVSDADEVDAVEVPHNDEVDAVEVEADAVEVLHNDEDDVVEEAEQLLQLHQRIIQ
jgi:hypothetical protein